MSYPFKEQELATMRKSLDERTRLLRLAQNAARYDLPRREQIRKHLAKS